MQRHVLTFALSAVWVAGCASGWPDVDRFQLPTLKTHPNASAVVLDEATQLAYHPGEKGPHATLRRTQRVVILKPDGASAATLYDSYSSSFQRVKSLRARTIAPDGTVEEFGASDVSDRPANEAGVLYMDYRVLQRRFSGLAPGTVVDWEVVLEDWEPTWRQYKTAFGAYHPVARSSLEVVVPASWRIEHLSTLEWAPVAFEPEVTTRAGQKVFRWVKENLEKVRSEPSGPRFFDVVPVVSVRLRAWTHAGQTHEAFATPEEFARWMHDVQSETTTKNAALEDTVKKILADVGPDPRAKARALYEWVQQNIRYVAVEVGIGGWRPHDALTVFEHRYGDCKDKANLLRTMLEIAGIESYLASIYSHRGLPRPFGLPGVGNSNHAILAVDLPDGLVLVDPTSRVVPFGALPPNDQGADVLVIHPEKPRIVRSAWSTPADNKKTLRIELEVDGEGPGADGRARVEAFGLFDWSLRRELTQSAVGEHSKMFKNAIRMRDVDANDPKFDAKDDGVYATAKVRVAKIGTQAAGRLVVRPIEFMYSPGRSLNAPRRTQPVVFGCPIVRETEVVLTHEGRHAAALPEPVELDSPYASYRQSWHREEGRLILRSRYERKATRVPAKEYDRLRAFFDAVVSARSQSVVLKAEAKS